MSYLINRWEKKIPNTWAWFAIMVPWLVLVVGVSFVLNLASEASDISNEVTLAFRAPGVFGARNAHVFSEGAPMIGTSYGSITEVHHGVLSGLRIIGLVVEAVDHRVVQLCIFASNYAFRENEAVSWNDTELYWHPGPPRKCVKFTIVALIGANQWVD
jgi:hypothetical protein